MCSGLLLAGSPNPSQLHDNRSLINKHLTFTLRHDARTGRITTRFEYSSISTASARQYSTCYRGDRKVWANDERTMWQQLRQRTLEKFELENCLRTDGKCRAIASCFRVKTNAAEPPSVLTDREAIVSSRGETAFVDVGVTHLNSASNQSKSSESIFVEHEKEKKRKYQQRVSGSFTL